MKRIDSGLGEMRALAIDPGGPRFGFAVLEGRDRLIDWGLRKIKDGKTSRGIRAVVDLIERYQPDALVLEEVRDKHAGRSPRVRRLVTSIEALGAERKIRTHCFTRSRMRAVFLQDGAFSKAEIAGVIADRLPVLSLSLPPVRKPWMSEDHRVNIFEAVALAMTFFDFEEKRAGRI